MEVNFFTEKLNKVQGNTYVVEEEAALADGVYEAELQHDNINESTLNVYTGSKLTGQRIETFALSTPSLAPWKRRIRIYADVPLVYISYETEGDTVEADDINRLQDAVSLTQRTVSQTQEAVSQTQEAVSQTQEAVNQTQEAVSLTQETVGGVQVAMGQMQVELDEECRRAEAAETDLQRGIVTEENRAEAAEAAISKVISDNQPNWEDKYTRAEVDNKFSALESAIDWKEAVDTYENLAVIYQNPEDGWTANVKDTNYTYRFNGTEWVAISANAIPKATGKVDGLLSKEDKTRYDDADSKKHTHGNQGVLDGITGAMVTKLSGIAEGANKYVHPTTTGNRHIPSGGAKGEILRWTADGAAQWGEETRITYGLATTAKEGLMSAQDKAKVNSSVQKGCTWNDLKGV